MIFFFKDTPELQIKTGNLSQSADRGTNETELLLLKRNFSFSVSERGGNDQSQWAIDPHMQMVERRDTPPNVSLPCPIRPLMIAK